MAYTIHRRQEETVYETEYETVYETDVTTVYVPVFETVFETVVVTAPVEPSASGDDGSGGGPPPDITGDSPQPSPAATDNDESEPSTPTDSIDTEQPNPTTETPDPTPTDTQTDTATSSWPFVDTSTTSATSSSETPGGETSSSSSRRGPWQFPAPTTTVSGGTPTSSPNSPTSAPPKTREITGSDSSTRSYSTVGGAAPASAGEVNRLATGALAAIVIASIAMILVIILLSILLYCLRHNDRDRRFYARDLTSFVDEPVIGAMPTMKQSGRRDVPGRSGKSAPLTSVLLTPYTTPRNSWFGRESPSIGSSVLPSPVGTFGSAAVFARPASRQDQQPVVPAEDAEEDLRPSPSHSLDDLYFARQGFPMPPTDLKFPRPGSFYFNSLSQAAYPSTNFLRPLSARSLDSETATIGTPSRNDSDPELSGPRVLVPSRRPSLGDRRSLSSGAAPPTGAAKRHRRETALTVPPPSHASPAGSAVSLAPIVEHDRDVGRMHVLLPPQYDPRWTAQNNYDSDSSFGHEGESGGESDTPSARPSSAALSPPNSPVSVPSPNISPAGSLPKQVSHSDMLIGELENLLRDFEPVNMSQEFEAAGPGATYGQAL